MFAADRCRLRRNQCLQIVELVKRRALALDEVVVIWDRSGLLAEPVDKNLVTGVVDGADKVRINDRVIDHQTSIVFVRRVVSRSCLGLDKVDRGDRRVTEIVKDGDRCRVGESLGIVRIEGISVLELRPVRNHVGCRVHVHAELDVRCRLRITRSHRQLERNRAVQVLCRDGSVSVDRVGQEILAGGVDNITVVVDVQRTVSCVDRLRRSQGRLQGKETLTGNRKIKRVQRRGNVTLGKLLLDALEDCTGTNR